MYQTAFQHTVWLVAFCNFFIHGRMFIHEWKSFSFETFLCNIRSTLFSYENFHMTIIFFLLIQSSFIVLKKKKVMNENQCYKRSLLNGHIANWRERGGVMNGEKKHKEISRRRLARVFKLQFHNRIRVCWEKVSTVISLNGWVLVVFIL